MPSEQDALHQKSKISVDFREVSVTGSQIYHAKGIPDYNPDSLTGRKGLQIYALMREDDQVKAVLTMKKFARLMTSWEIQPTSQDASDVEIAEFVKVNLDNLAGTFEDCLLNIYSGLDFGYSITEKIWYRIEKGKFAGKIGLRALKTREPFYYQFESDNYGNLREDGVVFQGSIPAEQSLLNSEQVVVQNTIYNPSRIMQQRFPVDKFIIYSYNKEFSNFYGRSDLRSAYRSWWSKEILMRFMNIYMERFGMPTHVAKYPKSLSKSEKTNLKTVLDKVQAKYSIVVPEDVSIELLNAGAGGAEGFKSAIEMHNRFISRSILVPDLMGFNEISGGGAYALGKKHFDVFLWILQKLGRDTEESIVGEQIIKQLVDYNYSNVIDYPKFKFESITAEGTATRANIVQMGVTGGFINPNEDWIREYLAIPKSDPSKPLGVPQGQLPLGSTDGVTAGLEDNLMGGEGLKDVEDKIATDIPGVEEDEFKVSKEYIEACKKWKIKENKFNKFQEIKNILIDKIKTKEGQLDYADGEKVKGMITRLQRGEELAPIYVDKDYYLLNGRHRLLAYITVSRKNIPVEIIDNEDKKQYKKINGLELDSRFDYKIDFVQMKEDLDDYQDETVDALSKIVQLQRDALLRTIERKKLVENKDYNGVNALSLRFVGDFKRELENRLIKLYLDSKLESLKEIEKGSEDKIEIVTKFAANITIQPWFPVQPSEAIDFFNRKVLAKIITSQGIKKLLTMVTRKELNYYNAKAFAIAGVEKDMILKKAKFILLSGLKAGDPKGTMFNLGKMFDEYLTTGEIVDDELVTSYRLETIVRTNFSEALNAGRKAMFDDPDVAEFVPYVQWKAILDDRVRPTHAAMHNRIFKRDNPVIDGIPPAGFNCRCLLVPVTKIDVNRLVDKGEGIELSDGEPLPDGFPDVGFNNYVKENNESIKKYQDEEKDNLIKIERCPYPNCGSDKLEMLEQDRFETRLFRCSVCKNEFKVTKEGEIYLFDKVNDKWFPAQQTILPAQISGNIV